MNTLLKSMDAFKNKVKKNIVIVDSEFGAESTPSQRFDEGKIDTASQMPRKNQVANEQCKATVRATISKVDRVKRFGRTILMRLLLIAYSILIVYFMACITQDSRKWYLMIPVCFIILDTLYICIVRKGVEFDW